MRGGALFSRQMHTSTHLCCERIIEPLIERPQDWKVHSYIPDSLGLLAYWKASVEPTPCEVDKIASGQRGGEAIGDNSYISERSHGSGRQEGSEKVVGAEGDLTINRTLN